MSTAHVVDREQQETGAGEQGQLRGDAREDFSDGHERAELKRSDHAKRNGEYSVHLRLSLAANQKPSANEIA